MELYRQQCFYNSIRTEQFSSTATGFCLFVVSRFPFFYMVKGRLPQDVPFLLLLLSRDEEKNKKLSHYSISGSFFCYCSVTQA